MSIQGQGFGNAGKTKCDMLLDLKIPLWRCLPDVNRLQEELPVTQSLLPANIGHSFGPSLLRLQEIFGEVRCYAEDPGLQRGFVSKGLNLGLRLKVRILDQILRVLDTGRDSQEKGFQLSLKALEFLRELIGCHRNTSLVSHSRQSFYEAFAPS